MRTFITKAGKPLENGHWYGFGVGFSLRHQGNGRLSIRHDLTGEVAYPAGPSGRDAIAMALYTGDPSRAGSYAYFCFGPALDLTLGDLLAEAGRRLCRFLQMHERSGAYRAAVSNLPPFSGRDLDQLHRILKEA